ncbi:MAG: hypothetical protein QM790_06465 [Nibricoccus sp.]
MPMRNYPNSVQDGKICNFVHRVRRRGDKINLNAAVAPTMLKRRTLSFVFRTKALPAKNGRSKTEYTPDRPATIV